MKLKKRTIEAELEILQREAFGYFVHETNPANGLVIDKTCSATSVVWNPWVDKAKRMSDFGDDEWPGMLCVEAANTGPHRITLLPESRHTTTTIISAETP